MPLQVVIHLGDSNLAQQLLNQTGVVITPQHLPSLVQYSSHAPTETNAAKVKTQPWTQEQWPSSGGCRDHPATVWQMRCHPWHPAAQDVILVQSAINYVCKKWLHSLFLGLREIFVRIEDGFLTGSALYPIFQLSWLRRRQVKRLTQGQGVNQWVGSD